MEVTTKEQSFGQAKKLPQYLAAISVSIGAVLAGFILTWSSHVSFALHTSGHFIGEDIVNELIWASSLTPLGALVMCLLIGPFCEMIGRKRSILVMITPVIAQWIFPFLPAFNGLFLYRFVMGMTAGGLCVAVPLYISEIAQLDIKGTLGSFFQLFLNIGFTLNYISDISRANGYNYNIIQSIGQLILIIIIPLIFLGATIVQPETPVYLLKKGRKNESLKSLRRLRGPLYDVQMELDEIQRSLEEEKAEGPKAPAKKGLFIIMGLMFFQQLSGINAVIFFISSIFSTLNIPMRTSIAITIVGIVLVVASLLATYLIGKLGRKFLLLVSAFVTTIGALLIGISFTFNTTASYLPLISLCIFVAGYSLGLGPIPWMIASDLFSPNYRRFASSIAGAFNWFLAFLVTKFFAQIANGIGNDSVFYIFAAFSLLGTFFIMIFIPETKGLTIEQVHCELRGEKPPITDEEPERRDSEESKKKPKYDPWSVTSIFCGGANAM